MGKSPLSHPEWVTGTNGSGTREDIARLPSMRSERSLIFEPLLEMFGRTRDCQASGRPPTSRSVAGQRELKHRFGRIELLRCHMPKDLWAKANQKDFANKAIQEGRCDYAERRDKKRPKRKRKKQKPKARRLKKVRYR